MFMFSEFSFEHFVFIQVYLHEIRPFKVSDSVYRDTDTPEHSQTERISWITCCIRQAEDKHQ